MFEKANDVLTVRQVAELLAVSEAMVYQLIHSGQLRSRKIGRIYRIRKAEVMAFLIAEEF